MLQGFLLIFNKHTGEEEMLSSEIPTKIIWFLIVNGFIIKQYPPLRKLFQNS